MILYKPLNLILITICIIISGCEGRGKSIVKSLDREGEEIQVTVKFLNPPKFLQSAKDGRMGLNGEVTYYREDNKCSILVKKRGKMRTDDKHTLTLGHELMHCLYGDYHK